MRRKTSKSRKSPQSVLRARVITRRTVWFGFLKFTGKLLKLMCAIAVLAGAGWGIWRGVEHAFFKNPDFQLKVIKLNPNPVIDELGVATVAGLDLSDPPNLFAIDIGKMTEKLNHLPEISEAWAERHPPGTLQVSVIARSPAAWISCPEGGLSRVRQTGAMLVDHNRVAYQCPPLLTETARQLPLIILSKAAATAITPGKRVDLPELEHALLLMEAARDADAQCLRWIDSIQQENSWSLMVTTRDGTRATFSLGDHDQQIERMRAALSHAVDKGYTLATINLIPRYNVPITLRDEPAPPKARPVTLENSTESTANRRSRDLNKILNRN